MYPSYVEDCPTIHNQRSNHRYGLVERKETNSVLCHSTHSGKPSRGLAFSSWTLNWGFEPKFIWTMLWSSSSHALGICDKHKAKLGSASSLSLKETRTFLQVFDGHPDVFRLVLLSNEITDRIYIRASDKGRVHNFAAWEIVIVNKKKKKKNVIA